MAFKDGFREFPVIRTERLLLDPLRPNDAAAMCRQMRALPDNSGWAGSYPTQSPEHARLRISHHSTAFKRKANIHWAIRKARGKSLIGVCKLFDFEYQTKAEIGYWIGQRYWSNGFATEVVRSVVSFAFDTLELHRVYALVDVTNVASLRVLEKAMFQKEGVLRRNGRRNGVWSDPAVFAILDQGSEKVR